MNTRHPTESSHNPAALSASFNQDASLFSIGHESGFSVYHTDPCQPNIARGTGDPTTVLQSVSLIKEVDVEEGVGAVELLERTNYLAFVGRGWQTRHPQNKVVIWNDAKKKAYTTLSVVQTVRGIRLSRAYTVIVLQDSIRIYKFGKQEVLHVYETADNPLGLCCLRSKVVAFPNRTPGQVKIVELATGNVSILAAHSTALRAIDISRDEEVIATASDKGTLSRVFSTSTGAKIAELRRGVDPATIYSIAIAPSGQLLAVTSDKGTLHVFDIPHPSKPSRSETPPAHQRLTSMSAGGSAVLNDQDPSNKWGFLGKIPLLPRVFSDTYSFASANFSLGDEPLPGSPTPLNTSDTTGSRPPKGIIGWTSDHTIVVIGAGHDSRWEKFIIAEGEDGKRYCFREGWKRILGVS